MNDVLHAIAIIWLTLIGLKQPLVTSQSKAGEARHAIPVCIVQTSYPSMQSPNNRPGKPEMLSQHAVTQSQAREARQAISASSHIITGQGSQTCYPIIHSADKRSQHALWNIHCIKEVAKAQNSDKLKQQISCRTRRDMHKKRKHSKQLQHLMRLGKEEAWCIGLHQWS